MGPLDFIKEAGASLFGRDKKEDQEIYDLLAQPFGADISNLKVEFKDGVVSLFGGYKSQAVKEKAVLLAGNVKDVKAVDNSHFSAPVEEQVEFYTVKPGDSLSKIAKAKVKTDKRDCQMLAHLLRTELLPEVYQRWKKTEKSRRSCGRGSFM